MGPLRAHAASASAFFLFQHGHGFQYSHDMQGEERDPRLAVELRQQREQRRPQLPGEHHRLLDLLPVARADDGRPVHTTVGRADGDVGLVRRVHEAELDDARHRAAHGRVDAERVVRHDW